MWFWNGIRVICPLWRKLHKLLSQWKKHWGEATSLSGKNYYKPNQACGNFIFLSFFPPLNGNTVVRVTRSVKSKGSFRRQTKTKNHEMHFHAVRYTNLLEPFFFFSFLCCCWCVYRIVCKIMTKMWYRYGKVMFAVVFLHIKTNEPKSGYELASWIWTVCTHFCPQRIHICRFT